MNRAIATRVIDGEQVPAWHLAGPRTLASKIAANRAEEQRLSDELGQQREPNAVIGIALIALAAVVLLATLVMADPASPAASQPRPPADGITTPARVEAAAGVTGDRP